MKSNYINIFGIHHQKRNIEDMQLKLLYFFFIVFQKKKKIISTIFEVKKTKNNIKNLFHLQIILINKSFSGEFRITFCEPGRFNVTFFFFISI